MKNRVDEIQHGGQHYKTDYQHWNLLPDVGFGLEYYLGCATKYITRHSKKNGREDVEKAIHFMQKAVELVLNGKAAVRVVPLALEAGIGFELRRYAEANGLTSACPEYHFLRHVLMGRSTLDYGKAIILAQKILEDYPAPAPKVSPVSKEFRPDPGGQFQQEGWWGDGTTLLKCKKCRGYFRMHENDNPHEVHQCLPVETATVEVDTGEPGSGYVNQG